jgi:cytochrome c peroxidase
MTECMWRAAWCVALLGCWSEEPLVDGVFTPEQWQFIQQMQLPRDPPRCPVGLSGDVCDRAADFGHTLFFEPKLSGPITIDSPDALGPLGAVGVIKCADCHDPKHFFVDTRSQPAQQVSLGANYTAHNALGLVNVAYKSQRADQLCDADAPVYCKQVYSWTGVYPSPEQVLILAGLQGAAMNSTEERMADVIHDDPQYQLLYHELFGGYAPTDDPKQPGCAPTETPCHTAHDVFTNLGLAFAAYVRHLNTKASPFDCYLSGGAADGCNEKTPVFGPAEKRGLAVFTGKGTCSDCHSGPLLSDLKFRNTGVPQEGAHVKIDDPGLAKTTGNPVDTGKFLTPPLRNVSETGPYMHAGQLASLHDVIAYYRQGGVVAGFSGIKDARIQPLEIDDDEASDLEAFLRSLTSPPLALNLTCNPKQSDPKAPDACP